MAHRIAIKQAAGSPSGPTFLSESADALTFSPAELELFMANTSETESASQHAEPLIKIEEPANDEEEDAAVKRSRRTEIERLSRRRRQATLRSMRDEVRRLETTSAHIMASHAVRKRSTGYEHVAVNDSSNADQVVFLEDDQADEKSEVQMKQLQERFIELKLHTSELETQQQALQRSLRGKELLSMSVQSLAFSLVRGWSKVDDDRECAPSPVHLDIQFQLPDAEEYAQFVREACERFAARDAQPSTGSSGSSCMGWADRRHEDDDSVVFSMTKAFHGHDVEAVMQKTWDVFSSEDRLREAFGARGATMQLRIVDRPSPDMVVIYRSNNHPRCPNKRHHVVLMLFRVRTEDGGYTICMRSMKQLETPIESPNKWTGIFTWIHLRPVPTDDGYGACHVVYNNFMPLRWRRRPMDHMFIAFLTTVVRWESVCIAPRLLLPV